MNVENERESMKVAHQLVEAKYDSRQDFISRAKYEVNRNFEAFVKNEKPDDPNEYKAICIDGVVTTLFTSRVRTEFFVGKENKN